jgi:hypothetical protein
MTDLEQMRQFYLGSADRGDNLFTAGA